MKYFQSHISQVQGKKLRVKSLLLFSSSSGCGNSFGFCCLTDQMFSHIHSPTARHFTNTLLSTSSVFLFFNSLPPTIITTLSVIRLVVQLWTFGRKLALTFCPGYPINRIYIPSNFKRFIRNLSLPHC